MLIMITSSFLSKSADALCIFSLLETTFFFCDQNSDLVGYYVLSFEKNIISSPVLTPTQTSHPCQQNNYFCVFHATALIEITF